MSIDFLKKHAQTLSEFAAETEARATLNPTDKWLAIAAHNQRQAATDALQALAIAHAQLGSDMPRQVLDERFGRQEADHAAVGDLLAAAEEDDARRSE